VKKLILTICVYTIILIAACTNYTVNKVAGKSEEGNQSETIVSPRVCSTGYIISVFNDSIWVIDNINESKINKLRDMSEQELTQLFRFKGTVYKVRDIDEQVKMKMKKFQKVRVHCTGFIRESAPANADAVRVEILHE